MQYTIVLGTSRIDNKSAHVVAAIETELKKKDAPVAVVTTAEYVTNPATVPPWGEGGADTNPSAWKDIVDKTDAFIFVLPEYNHSFPGEWKLLMDSLYNEYTGKKAFVVGVGGGKFAGARVMEHVMPVLVNFQFEISSARLHVASASKMFDENGAVVDAEFQTRLADFVEKITQ